MKASVVFNADGTITLLNGLEVKQFTSASSMLNYCAGNGISITRTHTMQ